MRFQTVPQNFKVGIVIVLIVVGGIIAFKYFQPQTSSTPQYQTTTAEKGTLIIAISSAGQISTANNASVTTQASGVVKKIFVQNGDQIKVGAPLLEIELDRTARQKYAQALSSYKSAQNSLASAQARLHSLQSSMFAANQKFINDAVARDLADSDPTYIQQNADWLAAEADYKNQQNVISQAQTALNSAWLTLQQSSPTVYAPISGQVTGLSLQVGSVLSSSGSTDGESSSQELAHIVTTATPTVTIPLTEIDAPKVSIDDQATITFDAFPDKTYTGKIISIDTLGSTSSNVTTYPAVIALDTLSPELLGNMAAQVNIITDTKDQALLVPNSAVQNQNGTYSVQVMRDGQPTTVDVTIGLASDTQTEITSGLNEGDQVITSTITTQVNGNRTTTDQSTQGTSPFSAMSGNRSFGSMGGGRVQMIQGR